MALKNQSSKTSGINKKLWCYDLAKRVLDICLGGGLFLGSLPIIVGIVVVIRLDSKGPAFFRQVRIGRYGLPFKVYKFRTMTIGSPTFGLKPTSFQDERLTRVGRFLRATSLDELPQLINVIKGDMSLVGPRPEQPFLVEQYEDWQEERLMVLPGLTGWWQVNGRKQPMHEYVEEDIFYVRNRSIWLDAKILLKTVLVVLSRDGAI